MKLKKNILRKSKLLQKVDRLRAEAKEAEAAADLKAGLTRPPRTGSSQGSAAAAEAAAKFKQQETYGHQFTFEVRVALLVFPSSCSAWAGGSARLSPSCSPQRRARRSACSRTVGARTLFVRLHHPYLCSLHGPHALSLSRMEWWQCLLTELASSDEHWAAVCRVRVVGAA